MTEYKKLVALSELLREDATKLSSLVAPHPREVTSEDENGGNSIFPISNDEAEELFAISSRIQSSLSDGCPRMRKMVQKARETDPNRQIYNETMCGKIEKVFESFCDTLEQLAPSFFDIQNQPEASAEENGGRRSDRFDALLDGNFVSGELVEHSPVLMTAEEWHNRYIVRRAKEEAWQSRVAEGLSDAVAFEAQTRALAIAEEKFARTAMTESKRSDKMRIIQLLESRAAAKWNAELQRREEELLGFRKRGELVSDVTGVPEYLKTAIPNQRLRSQLAKHTGELITALLRTPEDLNIRRLRNNNENFVRDYGHPCLAATAGGDHDSCTCASIRHAAEALWCRMGYVIRYTSAPNRSIESLRLEKCAERLVLPCGLSLSAHTYTPLGFEDYSERFFELLEPNAMVDANEWMRWYGVMQEMQDVLTQVAHE